MDPEAGHAVGRPGLRGPRIPLGRRRDRGDQRQTLRRERRVPGG